MSKLCKCGCGAEIKAQHTWVHGHNARAPKVMTAARLAQVAGARAKNWTDEARQKASASAKARADSTPEAIARRIAKYTLPADERGCVAWTGTAVSGYGQMRVGGRLTLATHLSLQLAGRPRPTPGHMACHSCDNPPCVNPDHLFWGTASDNMQDMVRKGRHLRGVRS